MNAFTAEHHLGQLEHELDFTIARAEAGTKDGHAETAAHYTWLLTQLRDQKRALGFARSVLNNIAQTPSGP